jgi:hypothetical protein
VTCQINPGQFLGLGTCTLPNSPRVWNPCSSTANTNLRRLFNLQPPQDGQYVGPEDTFDSGGTASDHGLSLAVEKRLSRHFSTQANYTWSHCIGDSTQGSTVGSAQAGLLDSNNRRFDRGNCSVNTLAGTFATDQRQIFNFTAVAETPPFSNRVVRAVGTGWQVAGILRKATRISQAHAGRRPAVDGYRRAAA